MNAGHGSVSAFMNEDFKVGRSAVVAIRRSMLGS
jgi:hypothetical protein